MKALIKRILVEWEKSLLWGSAGLLVLVIVFQISGLLGEKEGGTTAPKPAKAQRSYLNEATAFAFLQPVQVPSPDARNPFAFSCKVPEQAAPAQGEEKRKAWRREKTPQPPPPATEAAPAAAPAPVEVVTPTPPPPAPPAPKRAVTILYRGVYKGGDEAGRQLAFVSSKQSPGGSAGAMVAAVGQAMEGVTVKSFTPAALVVTSPAGEDVTIEIGQQKEIFLE